MNLKYRRGLKKALIPALGAIVVMGYLAIPPTTTSAAEKIKGDIALSGELLAGSYYTYSTQHTQYYNNISITPEAGKSISKVVIRNKNTKQEYKEVLRVNDTTFDLGTLRYSDVGGTSIEVSNTVTSWDGIWYWFRAPPPDDNIWIYDLNGSRYFHLNDGVYSQPQASAKRIVRGSSSPIPDTDEFSENIVGNRGRVEMDVSLPMYLNGDGQSFELSKFGVVSLDASYDSIVEGSIGYLASEDISDQGIVSQNLPNRTLRYGFTGNFVVPPVVDSDNSNGRVVGWKYRFNATVKSEVYKWPNLEIVYWEEPAGSVTTGPTSPTSNPTPSPTPTAHPESIVAKFEIEQPEIEYGEFNWAKPIGSSVTGGGYSLKEYIWTISQNGNTFTQSTTGVLTLGGFPSVPRWLSTGTVNVSLKVVSTSGNSASAGPQSFQVVIPPSCSSYNPSLNFNIGFVNHGNRSAWQAISTAFAGDYLDVQVLQKKPGDDTEEPKGPLPKDYISWDWEDAASKSPWLKKYYEDYNPNTIFEEYYSFPYSMILTNDNKGTHSIKATKTDACGNSETRTAVLSVIDPNPVAVIKGPGITKEARPLQEEFSSANSYSPKGTSINHSRDEWTNRQSVYYTPGTELVTLKVWDSSGLPSLNIASHTLTVLPDDPPVSLGKAPSKAIRGSPITIKDASYSPDGDELKPTELWEQYDSNNDGVYEDETLVSLTLENGKLSRQYTKVGKYRYKLRAVEVSPLEKESTSYFYVEVVDLAPSVFYTLKGTDFNPPASVTDYYPSSQIANDFSWGSYSLNSQKNYSYNAQEDAIETGKATWTLQSAPSNSGLEVNYNSYYCGDTWSCLGGPAEFITPTIFGNNGYATGFVDPYSKLTNGKRYGTMAKHHSYSDSINREEDLVWYNWYDYNSWSNSYIYYDDIYKLSDIQKALDTGTPVTPIQAREVTVKNKEDYDKLPLPDKYKMPPIKSSLDISKYLPVTYKSPGGTGSYNVASIFASDRADNSYSYDLDSKGKYYYAEGYFHKRGPSGNVLWSMPINLGYSHQIPNEVPVISYISPDNSSLILRSKLYLWFVDNNSGSIIKVIDGKGGIFNGSRIVYYTNQDSGERIYGDRVFDYYLNFYDIKTGTTTRSSTPFYRYVEKRDDDGDLIPPPPVTMIKTNDGNVIAFGGYLNSPPFNNQELMSLSVYSFTGQLLMDIRPGNILARPNPERVTFAGDGDMVVQLFSSGSDNSSSNYYLTIRSQPENTILTEDFGQLYNNSVKMRDGEIVERLKINFDNFSSNVSAGIAARIQDNENMYRFEVTPETSRLVKIQNGQRTVLASQSYSLNWREYYTLKLKISGERIQGFINGVPLLSATDGSFYDGYLGPFSGIPYSLIKDFSVTRSYSNEGKIENAVIVDSDVEVTSDYIDSEEDPEIPQLREWKYTHSNVNKFLDIGDGKSGLSSLHGRVVSSVFPKFDKVGEYELSYRVPDDPSPEGYYYPRTEFSNYREYSDPFVNKIIVHRRPISIFTVSLNAFGWIDWHDLSYDPDRWISNTNFSTESPYYEINRGIFGRKYKYSTPSGVTIEGKLTRPTESGTFTVSEAVMDEYGAWSDWYDQQIYISNPLPTNKAPVAEFDLPKFVYRDDIVNLINRSYDPDGDAISYNWSLAKPPYTSWLSNQQHPSFKVSERGLGKNAVGTNWFVTLEVTDNKGDMSSKTKSFTVLNHRPTTDIYGEREVLVGQTHSYQSNGNDLDSEDRTNLSYYWLVTDPNGNKKDYTGSSISLAFIQGGTYKLEHWVIDPVGASSSVVQYLVNADDNKPPVPGFTLTPTTVYRGEPAKVISTATDPDGAIVKHDYWIIGPGINEHWTNSPDWTRTYATLGEYLIRQRVEDNKGAAAETAQVLHVINRLPSIDLVTPSGLDSSNPSVNIPPYRAKWEYSDPDGDTQQYWKFSVYDLESSLLKISGQGNDSSDGFDIPTGFLSAGRVYYATVTVSDGYQEVTSAPKFFILNRPPVASFTFEPNPAWEGDTLHLTNTSTDPDGDTLGATWWITGPNGFSRTDYSYNSTILPSVTVNRPGAYYVTLVVTDPYGETSSTTQQIYVGQLGVQGSVNHTDNWEHNRQQYNNKYPDSQRTSDMFWAGEQFDLVGVPYDTGTSLTKPTSVSVSVEGVGTADLSMETYVRWVGSLGESNSDVKLESLSPGLYDFVFTVTYSNGVQKQDIVEVTVDSNWTEYFRNHRIK